MMKKFVLGITNNNDKKSSNLMSKSKKLFNDSKKVIPSGVNSPVRYFEPYPFFTKKSNGAYIWDEDNNRYIDFAMVMAHYF